MKLSMFQFTIRQMMIVAAIVAIVLGLAVSAMRHDDPAMMVLGIIWLTAPLWGSVGLAFLLPKVTSGLLLASCAVILPISGYFFNRYRSTPVKDLSTNEWLVLGLAALWLILPFAIGHALSKSFHAWRAENRYKNTGGERERA
jgi:hypothetical protein